MISHVRREQIEYYQLDSWEKVKPSILFIFLFFLKKSLIAYSFVFLPDSPLYEFVVKADKRYRILLSYNLPKKLHVPSEFFGHFENLHIVQL